MTKSVLVVLVALVAMSLSTVNAEILANWNMDGLSRTGGDAVAAKPATVHEDVTCSDFTFSPSLKVTSWADALTVYVNELSDNVAGAIAKKSYFAFTITPNNGKRISYSSLFSRVSVNTGNLSAGATIKLVLLSSVDGFDADHVLASFEASHPADNATATESTGTFDLSGKESLQNVSNAVEFRIYAILSKGVGNRLGFGHIFYQDGQEDLIVQGTVSE